MKQFALGGLAVDRVEETVLRAFSPEAFLTGVPNGALERERHWMAPTFYDPAANVLVLSVHSWIVRTRHHTVLIDSCCGNHKTRPQAPMLDNLATPYLERLAAKGLRPEDIDFVMCTHLHLDHIGWNTKLRDGRWVPTFPNARYVFGRKEYERWNPETGTLPLSADDRAVFEDSVLPVVAAGRAEIVDDGYCVDDNLSVQAAPGHTLGHVLIRAASGGKTGLFTGDALHTPLQVVYPDICTAGCDDPEAARQTRRSILEECAEHGHLLLPAHFGQPHCGHIMHDGAAFSFKPLAGPA